MTFSVGGVDVTAVSVGATPAVAVYLGSEKVWPAAGGAGLPPDQLPGLIGWWDAADAPTVIGTPVTEWQDKTGGQSMTTTGTVGRGIIDGKDVVTFDGSGYLSSNRVTGETSPTSVLAVGCLTGGSGQRSLFSGQLDGRVMAVPSGQIELRGTNNLLSSSVWPAVTLAVVGGIWTNTAGSQLIVDDQALLTGYTGARDLEANWYLGCLGYNKGERWFGGIAEVCIYDDVLTEQQMRAGIKHLMGKWQ